MEITLPWPNKKLSPNARLHFQEKARIVKTDRQLAFYMTQEKAVDEDLSGLLALRIIFHPPDRRRRDWDNLAASCKSYQDGVFSALNLDDSCIRRVTLIIGAPQQGGEVVIRINRLRKEG